MNINTKVRGQILAKISTALQRIAVENTQVEATGVEAARVETGEADANSISARFQALTQQIPAANSVGVTVSMSTAERIAHFIRVARLSSTDVEEFHSIQDLRDFLVKQVQENELAAYYEKSELIETIEWPSDINAKLSVDYKQAGQLGIMQADCAIVETGSVVLRSGSHHPIAAGFLVDTLIVVVPAEALVLGLEDVWPVITEQQKKSGMNVMPRSVNIITGPSRTADVEQKVQIGAHGPRKLMIAILNSH